MSGLRRLMVDSPLVNAASVFAYRAHKDQSRKFSRPGEDPEPYINHPIRVAEAVERITGDKELVMVALLHDVVEDTDATFDDLAKAFSPRVIEAVDALTRRYQESYRDFIARICLSADAWIVKRADILDNLSSLPPRSIALSLRYTEALAYMYQNDPRPG